MKKEKLGIIFGGMSTENEVSVASANSILKNLDREKYQVFPIYIAKDGTWYEVLEKQEEYQFGQEIETKKEIENVIDYLQKLDVLFPVLHGLYGEDGTIQGLFELVKKPYIGCKVLASSVGMDKVYTKIIFHRAGLKQAKYESIRKYKNKYIYVDNYFNETVLNLNEVTQKIIKNLTFPMFVKPSNSGSSVGINQAKNEEDLKNFIEYASQFDHKILIEEAIKGREVECSVLGNEEVIASCIGEVKSAEEFYSYDAKYKNEKSRTEIPADISDALSNEIRKQAIKAFKAIDGKGLARVDFFIEKETNQIYINEINTLPGFTNISMYPKLFEASGISYPELLSKVIELSKENP
ncbi:MAG: D-alanine--D-alanine ligase [Clostridia bacterium]|nr:D-alanine--D-alanine ligase [Clostridia bacterium]